MEHSTRPTKAAVNAARDRLRAGAVLLTAAEAERWDVDDALATALHHAETAVALLRGEASE